MCRNVMNYDKGQIFGRKAVVCVSKLYIGSMYASKVTRGLTHITMIYFYFSTINKVTKQLKVVSYSSFVERYP